MPSWVIMKERLCHIDLPCDAVLAGAAAGCFARVALRAGAAVVGDGLLAAAAGYLHGHCRLLSGEVGYVSWPACWVLTAA